MYYYLLIVWITGNDIVCQFKGRSWHWDVIVTPACVGDRRTHLEAAVQAGKAGGDSLTGLSFIWAEPDQLFLIKMRFAACSNMSMLTVYVCVHMCMCVCSETIQLCFLYRYSLNVAQNFKTCSEKWLCLIEAGFPEMAFCRETGNATFASQGTTSGRVHKAYLLETWVHNSQFDRYRTWLSYLQVTGNISLMCAVIGRLKLSLFPSHHTELGDWQLHST